MGSCTTGVYLYTTVQGYDIQSVTVRRSIAATSAPGPSPPSPPNAAALLGLATAATVTMSRATSSAVQLPLMLPYLVWVSYATALNANICLNNPTERLIKVTSVGPS